MCGGRGKLAAMGSSLSLCGFGGLFGTFIALLKTTDLDDAFAYKTPVVAVIRDRYLGFTKLFFIIGIIGYVGLWNFFWKKGYAIQGVVAPTIDVTVFTPLHIDSGYDFDYDCQFAYPDFVHGSTGNTSEQQWVLGLFETCGRDLASLPNASALPFCDTDDDESQDYYGGKLKCLWDSDLEIVHKISAWSVLVSTRSTRLLQENHGYEIGNTFVNDWLKVTGSNGREYYLAGIPEMVVDLQQTLDVENFDFQQSGSRMRGFLISRNEDYCNAIDFAESHDKYDPGKKYGIYEKMSLKLRTEYPKAKCFINLNRTNNCMILRQEAKSQGKDLNQLMRDNYECLADRFRMGTLFEVQPFDPNVVENETLGLDAINPLTNKTYRHGGVDMQLVIDYTNEDLYRITGEAFFTIMPTLVENSTAVVHTIEKQVVQQVYYRQVNTYYGVSLNIIPRSRRILQFSHSATLNVLTSAFLLLKVASSMVDTIMMSTCLFKWRAKLYKSVKYVRSKDFSDLGKEIREGKRSVDKINPLEHRRVSKDTEASLDVITEPKRTLSHDASQNMIAIGLALEMRERQTTTSEPRD